MNLFLPSPNIEISVHALDDKRIIKMCLETAQLLSSAVRLIDEDTNLSVYKLTHKNHPVSIWVRQSSENFAYTLEYFKAICDEYSLRFGKTHKSFLLYPLFNYFKHNHLVSLDTDITPFVNCTDFLDEEIHTAYKKCLSQKWCNDKRSPKWTKRQIPTW